MWCVYFIKSLKNGRVYVGYTAKEAKERLNEHNCGSNKWTSHNGPFKLIYFETYCCMEDAKLREKFYKSGFGRRIRDAIIGSVSAIGGPAS